MKRRWLIPIAVLLPLRLYASDSTVGARVANITIDPNVVTILHLRPEFESSIHMPEEISSVILGSPGSFKAEHSEGEPEYVYIKPITRRPVQSNLLITTKSGQHVTLELISGGAMAGGANAPVDFLIQYRPLRSMLILSNMEMPVAPNAVNKEPAPGRVHASMRPGPAVPSALDLEFEQQQRINAPSWTKWDGKQIETSIGDVREWNNQTVVSYSVFNGSDRPVEIVPPQIQITAHKLKKKNKEGKGIISDQLEIRDFRLSATRLEPGGRADGVVVFDRPNFMESSEKLFLQLAQADQVDRPVLIRLPFTPPIQSTTTNEGAK